MTSKGGGVFRVVSSKKSSLKANSAVFCCKQSRSRYLSQEKKHFSAKKDFEKAVFRSRFFKKREIANTLFERTHLSVGSLLNCSSSQRSHWGGNESIDIRIRYYRCLLKGGSSIGRFRCVLLSAFFA